MNYLAHLLLADDTDESILGNLLPDFVRGSTRSMTAKYSPEVMAGVERHRFVDAFTDAHPSFLTSRARLDPSLGLLRGVIIDVFYDHLLIERWPDYCDQPLERFTRGCYAALDRQRAILSPHLAEAVSHWLTFDVLAAYRTMDGVAFAFERIDARLQRRTGKRFDLRAALPMLQQHRSALLTDFDTFFPALIAALADRRVSVADLPTNDAPLPLTQ